VEVKRSEEGSQFSSQDQQLDDVEQFQQDDDLQNQRNHAQTRSQQLHQVIAAVQGSLDFLQGHSLSPFSKIRFTLQYTRNLGEKKPALLGKFTKKHRLFNNCADFIPTRDIPGFGIKPHKNSDEMTYEFFNRALFAHYPHENWIKRELFLFSPTR
jgi:hypothetical protein